MEDASSEGARFGLLRVEGREADGLDPPMAEIKPKVVSQNRI